MAALKLEAKEIPSERYCRACSFGCHYYFNEEDEVGITHCGLFDAEVEEYDTKLAECLENFPYGGKVFAVAKAKPAAEKK